MYSGMRAAPPAVVPTSQVDPPGRGLQSGLGHHSALHCLEAANPTGPFLLDWRFDVQRYGLCGRTSNPGHFTMPALGRLYA